MEELWNDFKHQFWHDKQAARRWIVGIAGAFASAASSAAAAVVAHGPEGLSAMTWKQIGSAALVGAILASINPVKPTPPAVP